MGGKANWTTKANVLSASNDQMMNIKKNLKNTKIRLSNINCGITNHNVTKAIERKFTGLDTLKASYMRDNHLHTCINTWCDSIVRHTGTNKHALESIDGDGGKNITKKIIIT